MRIYSLLAVTLTLLAAYEPVEANDAAATDLACYELPVVVVSAVDRSFPDPTCNQRRYPASDCLKDAVHTRVEVVDNGAGKLNCLHDPLTDVYEHVTSNYRGQASLFYPKHQINVKFPAETTFLGMPEDTAFVLNGPFLDCSLLRNHMTHWLFRATGRYSPRTRHVVMFMRKDPTSPDHEVAPEYAGIYLLLEKVSYGKNRVNLAPMDAACAAKDPEVLTGGWAWGNDPPSYGAYSPNMVLDQYQNEFGMGERPILAHPSGSQLSQQMRDHFVGTESGFLPQLYRTLWNNMTNPMALEEHLDLGSFADYLLHTEMSLNVDAYRRSTFFFKDRDQTINAGPVWDMNLAYGNGARRHFQDWIYPQYTYWKRLMCNSQLASLVIQRWKTLRGDNAKTMDTSASGAWSDESIVQFLDASAAPMHRQLSKCRGGDWRSNVVQCAAVDLQTCNGTYAERVEDLKNAVLARAHWMDERIEELYKPLDAQTCSGVGELPKYNCGVDGDDDGCLSDPEKYYNAVPFPAVRKPYSGPSCSSKLALARESAGLNSTDADVQDDTSALSPYQKPSVDHCWQSAGMYVYPEQKGVKDHTLTTFCNGYGSCPQGPGATCTCSANILLEKPSCRRIDAENEHYMRKQHVIATATATTSTNTAASSVNTAGQDAQEVVTSKNTEVSDALVIAGSIMGGMVLLLTAWALKKRSHRRRIERLGEYTPVRYGSIGHAEVFSQGSRTAL